MSWKLGVEVELVAPRGKSRRDLARALAGPEGAVRTFWHTQSEPAEVPGTPVFHNLTQGFEARDAEDRLIARLVDDLTLQEDLDRRAAPQPGWYRIVSDDPRLLRLVARHADPDRAPLEALRPLATLFGSTLQEGSGGMVKLVDDFGASVALAAPLPGERERGAELVTPPIGADHGAVLAALLAPARALGFLVPVEAAVHLHFDATPLCAAGRVRGLVRSWEENAALLKALVGTNPRCRRLSAWAPELRALVERPEWPGLDWAEARGKLAALNLTKYCDLNLRNLAMGDPDKHTVEVRVLPGSREVGPILESAALFEALLRAAGPDTPAGPALPWSRLAAERLIARLPLTEERRRRWLVRAFEVDRDPPAPSRARS